MEKLSRFDKYDLADAVVKTVMVIICVISVAALVLPSLLVVVMSFNSGEFITFPPQGLSLRWYRTMAESWEIKKAALVSINAACVVTFLDILLGVPAAWVLVRCQFKGRELLNSFILSPLMLPGMIIGIGILFFFSLMGAGISYSMMILSHVVVTLPYTVRLTVSRLMNLNPTLEEASKNLGANTIQTFLYIVLPKLIGGIVAGAAFSFLMSFDNLTVSLFTSSINERPLPLEVFYLLRYDVNPVVASISTVEIILATVVLLIGSCLGGGASAMTGKAPKIK